MRTKINFHEFFGGCSFCVFLQFVRVRAAHQPDVALLLAPGIIITQNDILKIIAYTPSTGEVKNQQKVEFSFPLSLPAICHVNDFNIFLIIKHSFYEIQKNNMK